MRQSRKRRRDFPFYKVQVFDVRLGTWKDEHRTFDRIEDAGIYIDKKKFSQKTRIIHVEEKQRRVLESHPQTSLKSG